MQDDIFGEPPAALDTSDIDERWEPVTDTAADAVAEHDAEFDDADEDILDEADADDLDDDNVVVLDDEDDADDEEPAATLDPDDLPAHLAGKSPAELAKIVQDSQTQIGRQSGEVAELRRITTEQADQIRELIGYLQQGPPEPQVDTSDLVAQALDNPQAAYSQAIRLVNDGHATPDLVEDIIEAVEDLSPKLARQMDRDFTRRMTTAELRNEFKKELDERVTPLANSDYATQVNTATASLYNDPVLGEDAKAYEQEVVALLLDKDENGKPKPLGRTAAEIRAKIESALVVARGNDPTKSSQYKKALAALKGDAQTEGGGSGDPKPAKKSEADVYRDRAFAKSKDRDPGAALFA